MTGKWVYPKRTDGVFAVCFNGTQEAAQEISVFLRLVVAHRYSPPSKIGDTGGELLIGSLTPIQTGQYVIIDQNHDLVEVLDYDAYYDKYSDNGL